MTLVVARIVGSRISIAADTMISDNDKPLNFHQGVIKSCVIPGGICVSFAGSPELAAKEIWEFTKLYPGGAGYSDTVSYFEKSSRLTNNDYIVAFAKHPKIVKITQGKRQSSLSKTLWIGDKSAYETFRAFEAKAKEKFEHRRAISAVLMANEHEGSPSSDLYSVMRHVVLGREVPTVGGFVSLVSNSEEAFRYPCLSDMLFDWPVDVGPDFELEYNDKINFGASEENAGVSISQFSSGYNDVNLVGFYFLRGRLAYIFHPVTTLMADTCTVIRDVGPAELLDRLNENFKTKLGWLLWIASASPESKVTKHRTHDDNEDNGIQMGFIMNCNTFPPSGARQMLPPLKFQFPGPKPSHLQR
jgi:hypothetical protein